MGNEESSPINESVRPQTLAGGRTIEALGDYMRSDRTKKIVVMVGAGISTSAGIPDFRSPDTGLYANLARLKLPYAEAVFDISYFRRNPEPFYTLAHELYPGKFRPTITHSFIRLLHDKGLLLKLFTQNIDCLEREAGVPEDKIVEAHGSFARQSCIECHAAYPGDEIQKHIAARTIPRCPKCEGLVKPEIVFFGEALPADFFRARNLPAEADLCIVLGTSLTVHPFASLPDMVRQETPRVLINMERVGGLGYRSDDVLILGDCDGGVRKLAEACGWLEELEKLWARTTPKDAGAIAASAAGTATLSEKETVAESSKSRDETLVDEVEKLAQEVDETLNLSKWHEERVRNEKLPTETVQASRSSETSHENGKGTLGHVFVGSSEETQTAKAETSKETEEKAQGEPTKATSEITTGNQTKDESVDGSKL